MAKLIIRVNTKKVNPQTNVDALAADIRNVVANITGIPATVDIKDNSSMSVMDARLTMDKIKGSPFGR